MTYEKLMFFHTCDSKQSMAYLIQRLTYEEDGALVTQFLLDCTDVLCDLTEEEYEKLKLSASDDENPFLTSGLSLQDYEYRN